MTALWQGWGTFFSAQLKIVFEAELVGCERLFKYRQVHNPVEPEGAVVLGSDTVVAADGKILGKPKSHEEAYEMIKRLAGRSHQVYTGVCIVKKGTAGEKDTVVSFYDETDVNVSTMTEAEIREYADSEEPMDKAGSYAVQGFFARYIEGLKGSYANVMGLPVHLVYQKLKELGAV